jgi:hypothetical protein
MTEILHQRARRIRERELVRAWEYRQREYSHGVWFRLRRVLADAAQAWIIGEDDAGMLEKEGFSPEPVGREIEPPKRMFVLPASALGRIGQRKEIAVRLSADFLAARSLVLIPHDNEGSR